MLQLLTSKLAVCVRKGAVHDSIVRTEDRPSYRVIAVHTVEVSRCFLVRSCSIRLETTSAC